MNESMPGRIFSSYRRQETAWPAGRLYDVLVEHFPAEQVFKDVDNIDPDDDFVELITGASRVQIKGPGLGVVSDRTGVR